ncbi:MAG: sigma-70 family RNA polymerase sigma factor [Planctomycetes bacterium]|nr:sigma-70 family RNA polymerase sigma factor [Planctomycetota bacterium]
MDGLTPRLDQISTIWPAISDPVKFVLRYATAVRKYLDALLKDPHDAEDVAQEFLLHVFERGFVNAVPERGRFRDYLKRAVRNTAISYWRRKHSRSHEVLPDVLPADVDDPHQAAEAAWLAEWRRCVLNKAWLSLEAYQIRSPGNLFHTVLRLSVDHPDESSDALAARASRCIGRPLRADAFRKQLSRARRHFAGLLLHQVLQELESPTPEEVRAEFDEFGLMPYVADFLPPEWQGDGPSLR